jgi:hypothetical protein
MFSLALSLIRNHKAGLAGVFVAVLFGSAVLTACGVLIDSGLRGGYPPERYAAASVVVGAPQSLAVSGSTSQSDSERVPVPADWVSEIARVPGVKTATGDVSVNVSLVTGSGEILTGPTDQPILAHGWSSAELGPFTIAAGTAPRETGEVVLDTALAARAGVRPGDTVEVLVGSVPSRYRVAGLASPPPGGLHEQSAIFFTDAVALLAAGHPDQVDTVGVIAEPGVGASELARRIAAAVPGSVTYTGADRADAEFLGIGQGRQFLLQAAGSLGGTMAFVVMFVVIAALGLSIQQRRQEMALLRAIAATPRQIHRMIGTEVLLVSCVAAVIGVLPGLAVSFLLRDAFASAGVIPANFTFVIDPLPPIAAVAVCVVVARVAGERAPRGADQDIDRDHPVLGAVVQRPLNPPQLGGMRVERRRARGGQLGHAKRQVGLVAGRQQAPSRPGLQSGHRWQEHEGDADRRHADEADGNGAKPVVHRSEPQGGIVRAQRQGERQEANQQPEQRVARQPGQLPADGGIAQGSAGAGRYRFRGHDLRTPPGQPGAFPVGDGAHRSQRGGHEEQPDSGQAQHCGNQNHQQRAPGEYRGAQASGQTADRLPTGLGPGADAGFPGPGDAHSFGEHPHLLDRRR